MKLEHFANGGNQFGIVNTSNMEPADLIRIDVRLKLVDGQSLFKEFIGRVAQKTD